MANPALTGDPGDTPVRAPYVIRGMSAGALILSLQPGASFEELRAAIRTGFGAAPARFAGACMRLDVGSRDVDLFELRRLIHLLKGEFSVDVVGLHCSNEALLRFAEREFKLKVHLHAAVAEPEAAPPPPAPSPVEEAATELVSQPSSDEEDDLPAGGRLLSIDGTVRSGAVVRFAGDIQIFGDVNPGAQLIAGGNILVLGALKGLAHAGFRGDDRSVILAFDMRPTQLRIGKVIQLPKALSPEQEARHVIPEVAWIHNGSIQIEPYRGRLPHAFKEST